MNMEKLPLIPIEDSVVFPGMTATLALDVGDADRVFLVPRHGAQFGSVGTVAQVADRMKIPGGIEALAFEGLYRGVAGAASTDADGRLHVEVTEHRDSTPTDERTRELEREYRAVVEEIPRSGTPIPGSRPSCGRSGSPVSSPTPPATRRT
jgi:ATP-dependent Lon protease